MQRVPGERFEYEMRALLLAARAGQPVAQVPIAIVYLEDNASSHFRPVADSLRAYAPMLRFAISHPHRRSTARPQVAYSSARLDERDMDRN